MSTFEQMLDELDEMQRQYLAHPELTEAQEQEISEFPQGATLAELVELTGKTK